MMSTVKTTANKFWAALFVVLVYIVAQNLGLELGEFADINVDAALALIVTTVVTYFTPNRPK